MVERGGMVTAGIGPHLERSKLSDAVFDVIERMNENMQLPMPKTGASRFVAAPVHLAAKAVHQRNPGSVPLRAAVTRVGVNPVLEGIDGGDPGENVHDALQV